MYVCPNCSGNLKFDIASQKLHCEYCGTFADPYEIRKDHDAEENKDEYEVTVFTCPQCGGEIISEDTTAATFCSFCGGATVLDSRVSKERRPAKIIPFSKTREDCKLSYNKMMKRAFFAPKEYKNPENIEKFRGIYMPYWVYSYEKKGHICVEGEKSYRRGDYIYTNHCALGAELEEVYHGLTYDASASFADNLSEAIAPFDISQGKEFAPTFLSGFYADTSDVERDVYELEAEEIILRDAGRRLLRSVGFRKYEISEYEWKTAVSPTEHSTEFALFPVWFLSYRSGDRVSYAVVNGQTGKVAAEIPVDPKKYAIGSALLTFPIFLLLNLFFTLKPAPVLGIAILLAFISILISNRQIVALKTRENMEDDRGLASVKKSVKFMGEQKLQSNIPEGKIIYKIIGLIFLFQIVIPFITVIGVSGNITAMFVFIACALSAFSLIFKKAIFPGSLRNDLKKTKIPLKEKMKTLWKPISGIIVALLILLINPVHDWYYYIGVIFCMGMIIGAFLDIIRHHNELTTRKLPQFNRRGGDENA